MIWLAAQIWGLMIAAFALGVGVSAWAFSAQNRRPAKRRAAVRTAGATSVQASEPAILFDRPDGEPDDLTQIIGIDLETAGKLNEIGVFHLRQIAGWDESAARWIELRLNDPGRVSRERWAEQASAIA
ncbi:MAG TPA: hypothetical protein PKH09_15190 [Parvularculaceae bacterium]|nr:hypothetical protein [Parvularculaceae bacterium]